MPEGTEREAGPKLAKQILLPNFLKKMKVAPFVFSNHWLPMKMNLFFSTWGPFKWWLVSSARKDWHLVNDGYAQHEEQEAGVNQRWLAIDSWSLSRFWNTASILFAKHVVRYLSRVHFVKSVTIMKSMTTGSSVTENVLHHWPHSNSYLCLSQITRTSVISRHLD